MDNEFIPGAPNQGPDPSAFHDQLNKTQDDQAHVDLLMRDTEASPHQRGAVAVSLVILSAFATAFLLVYFAADKLPQLLRLIFP